MNDSRIALEEAEPTQPSPEQQAAPEPFDVCILPAELFFIERMEIPAALDANELDDFAELSMESLAPFPLEQLNWGFLCDLENQTLVLYAALRDRLKRAGYEALESYTWVLPDFACLLGARFAEPVDVALKAQQHTSHLRFSAGEELPFVVEDTSTLTEGTDPTKKNKTARLELTLIQPEIDEKARPTFHFETNGNAAVEGHWSPLSPHETSLWRADIRPASFKAAERSARRTTALITRLLRYAAIFALGLIVLEGLLWVGQFWLGTRQNKIADQATAVRRVEDKQSLTNKLEQVAQNELRPIAILEAANQIRLNLGNSGIEYDETVIEGSNRITIEGKANTINELNAYTDSLNDSGTFALVGSPRQVTRSGKTTFTVTLDYQHPDANREPAPETRPVPTPEPMEPAAPAESTEQAQASR